METTTMPDRHTLEQSLIESLSRTGKLTPAAAERAIRVRAESGESLHLVLSSLGLVSEQEIADTMGAYLGLPVARPEDFPDSLIIEQGVTAKFLRESCILPLMVNENGITLAMADPLDSYARRAIEMSTGRTVLPWVAAPSDIRATHERLFDGNRTQMGRIVDEIADADDAEMTDDVERLKDLASEAPVIRLVNLIIMRAIEARASDIHIEPSRNRLLVRYRIDGILHEEAEPPAHLRSAIASRIKIMARMNIAERRLPQDGRIRFGVRGRDLDLRVSTIPTLYGEAVVMRILDRSNLVTEFATLGFDAAAERALAAALDRPQGVVLVTGPTGSGKTTSLYASLARLNVPGRKLFTVEDPIEYELEGVNQVQVKSQIGLSFAHVLRSMLRQDPDIIMVGEIRDLETAQVAVQAALTGHLVLSTLHTNDAASSVTRLLDMGVEDYLVTSTVTAVVAQRLARRLCPHCSEAYRALPEMLEELGLPADDEVIFRRAVGCEACRGTGYHGRVAITEILTMTDPLRKLVLKRADARELRQAAIAAGMLTLQGDGLAKARAGLTTIGEVLRVTGEG